MSVARAMAALAWRDVLVLARRPSRIVAAVGTAGLVWLFFAGGFADALAAEGGRYAVGLASGVGLLVGVMGSVFAGLGLIRDREDGFLRAVLAGPTPAWAVGVSRALAGGLLAGAQALPVVAAAAWIGREQGVGLAEVSRAWLVVCLASVGVAGVATAGAWWVRSIEGFHGLMNLVLMPMWLLSGAVFPARADGVLGAIATLNPLAYAHRAGLAALGAGDGSADGGSGVAVSVFALAGIALAGAAAHAAWARR